jgi:hypothetical protein
MLKKGRQSPPQEAEMITRNYQRKVDAQAALGKIFSWCDPLHRMPQEPMMMRAKSLSAIAHEQENEERSPGKEHHAANRCWPEHSMGLSKATLHHGSR